MNDATDNPLVDAVSRCVGSDSAHSNHPEAYRAFGKIVEALRSAGLYRYPGDPAPARKAYPAPVRKARRR